MPCQEHTSSLPTLTYSMTFKILEPPKCYWLNVNVGTWEGGSQPWAMNSQRNIMGSWINESSITCWKNCNQSNARINMFKKAAARESCCKRKLLARFVIHNMSVQERTKITTLASSQYQVDEKQQRKTSDPCATKYPPPPPVLCLVILLVTAKFWLSVSHPLCLYFV